QHFQNRVKMKSVTLKILDREEYEKLSSFYFVLEEPKWMRRGMKGDFTVTDENEEKQPLTSKEEEERRIAEMGRPVLGEHSKLEIIIEESYEFKV
uniref:Solute carrier family 8 member A1 n=1 Tax=Latimeria chalumnae TaxID=7897 RepID=H3AH36_LATCH